MDPSELVAGFASGSTFLGVGILVLFFACFFTCAFFSRNQVWELFQFFLAKNTYMYTSEKMKGVGVLF